MSIITIVFIANMMALFSYIKIFGRLIGYNVLQNDPYVLPLGVWSLITIASIPAWIVSLLF